MTVFGFEWANHLSILPSHPGQLNLLSSGQRCLTRSGENPTVIIKSFTVRSCDLIAPSSVSSQQRSTSVALLRQLHASSNFHISSSSRSLSSVTIYTSTARNIVGFTSFKTLLETGLTEKLINSKITFMADSA